MNKKLLFAFLLILIGVSFVSADYIISNPRTSSSFGTGGGLNNFRSDFSNFDQSMCQDGTDFIVQIAPFGCEPAVVRSDLLEDQDVHVFCEIQATKLNPLIDVSNIDSIAFSGNYPPEVRSIGFYPKNSAVGENRPLNNLRTESIGYVVISLRRINSENSLLNCEEGLLGTEVCRVSGELTARIRYDLTNSFGIRQNHFYLPVLSDSEFDELEGQYSFYNNLASLRADYVDADRASIGIYSSRYVNNFNQNAANSNKQKINQFILREGESSPQMFLPGLECLSGVSLKLEDISVADTTVKLSVNSELVELREGEFFLDGRCRVIPGSLEKNGLNQKVDIRCDEDNSGFLSSAVETLRISPQLVFGFEGEERITRLGEKIGEKDGINYYFAYLRNKKSDRLQTYDVEFLEAVILSIPVSVYQDDTLTGDMIKTSGNLAESFDLSDLASLSLLDFLKVYYFDGPRAVYQNIVNGYSYSYLDFFDSKDVKGALISIDSFADGENFPLNQESRKYYEESMNHYDEIINAFANEKYPEDSAQTISVYAHKGKINLAKSMGQKTDLKNYCQDYFEEFSDLNLQECQDDFFYSSESSNFEDFLIEGNFKRIELRSINEPTFEDYGAVVYVRSTDGDFNEQFRVAKNQNIYLGDEGEYFSLEEILSENSIKISVQTDRQGFVRNVQEAAVGSNSGILIKDDSEIFGSDYIFTLKEVNLKRVAKVKLNTNNQNQVSEVEFPFSVGIEKRAIQLSPNKTAQRIENLNKTLSVLEDVSNGLETSVEVMKTACLATGVGLTAKNLIEGRNGEIIARKEVMRGAGGWYEICAEKVSNGEYSDNEACYLDNADLIDGKVENLTEVIGSQNEKIKLLQEAIGINKDVLGVSRVNTTELVKTYSQEVSQNLSRHLGSFFTNPSDSSEAIDIEELSQLISKEGWENRIYSLEDLKEIDLYLEMYLREGENSIYAQKLYSSLKQIEVNQNNLAGLTTWSSDSGIDSQKIGFFALGQGSIELPYYGSTFGDLDTSVKDEILGYYPQAQENDAVQLLQTSAGQKLIVLLDSSAGKNTYPVLKSTLSHTILTEYYLIFDEFASLIEEQDLPEDFRKGKVYFRKYDRADYSNTYKNAELKYYETEPYKGMPAVVPFDLQNGWYAYVKQNLPVGGNLGSYQNSGVVSSFYVCNVGPNGIEQFNIASRDDVCQLVNINTGQAYDQFPGLERAESQQIISRALNAIQEAQRSYRSELRSASILGNRVQVGSPEVDNSGLSCSDYMSPKDCLLLFNVCDPVICPNDRCDFGGRYPVRDVTQSGLIGSVALCLPNAQEGIKVPICLSGVSASVQGYESVAESYRDCLQTSLDTGENVGICDQIHSVYMCEFVWRQAQPLAKLAVPKVLGLISGETNIRGGAEYMRIEAAWENTKESISYFTDFYSVNSYNAFKARTTDSVGTDICRSFVSQVYPTSGGIFNSIIEADSPAQFHASYDEILFTTATFPSTSHYKVNYHIYAGEDQGAYYRVYFRGAPDSTYFQSIGSGRAVDSGFIPAGEYASETIDFTAPSGYKELCVVVNNQEECGFKEVTTSFAKNFVKDQYIERQILENDITTERACISGTADIYSLTNLNVQEGVDDLISPEIYNRGVIRICSTDNPGSASDPYYGTPDQRWVEMGYCDDANMKCWLDKESVAESFVYDSNANEALENLTETHYQELLNQSKYIQSSEFATYVEEILAESDLDLRLIKIENLTGQIFLNNHRAYAYFLKGNVLGDMAILRFRAYKKELAEKRLLAGQDEDKPQITSSSEVLPLLDQLIGSIVDKNVCLINADQWGPFSCFSAVMAAYEKIGVQGLNCVYSEVDGKEFTINSGNDEIKIGSSGDKDNNGDTIYITNTNACSFNSYSENDKLNLIQPGYQIDLVSDKGSPHSVIFIEWENKRRRVAKVFDWNGALIYEGEEDSSGKVCDEQDFRSQNSEYCKTYSYQEFDLSDDSHPVYIIRKPTGLQTDPVPISPPSSNFPTTSFSCNSEFCNSASFTTIKNSCEPYEDYFVEASNDYNVPINHLVVLAYKESRCKEDAISNLGAYGIMQVTEIHCGSWGLSSNTVSCKNELLEPKTGIEVGAQILEDYRWFNGAGKTFKGEMACDKGRSDKLYKGWDAALRSYVGWGCAPGHDDYVEEINFVLDKIGSQEIFS